MDQGDTEIMMIEFDDNFPYHPHMTADDEDSKRQNYLEIMMTCSKEYVAGMRECMLHPCCVADHLQSTRQSQKRYLRILQMVKYKK